MIYTFHNLEKVARSKAHKKAGGTFFPDLAWQMNKLRLQRGVVFIQLPN